MVARIGDATTGLSARARVLWPLYRGLKAYRGIRGSGAEEVVPMVSCARSADVFSELMILIWSWGGHAEVDGAFV